MVNVCIQKDLFAFGESLSEILKMRMASVLWREKDALLSEPTEVKDNTPGKAIDAFLCSLAFVEKHGGLSDIVEVTRSMRAKKLMIVEEDNTGLFQVSQEMNGKLIEA